MNEDEPDEEIRSDDLMKPDLTRSANYSVIDPVIATGAVRPIEPGKSKQRPKVRERRRRTRGGLMAAVLTNGPLLLLDALALVAVLAITFAVTLYVTQAGYDRQQLFNFHAAIGSCYLAVSVLVGLHRSSGVNPVLEFRRQVTVVGVSHTAVLVLAAIYGTIAPFEVAALAASCVLGAVILPAVRGASRRIMKFFPWWGERVMLIGEGHVAEEVAEHIREYPQRGLRLTSVIAFPDCLAGIPDRDVSLRLADIDCAIDVDRPNWMIVAFDTAADASVRSLLPCCARVNNVVVVDSVPVVPTLWADAYECGGVFGVRYHDGLVSSHLRFVKRLCDIVFSVLILAMLAIPMGLVAASILASSPGPVLFKHRRLGRGGRKFFAWKFRTMVPDAEKVLDDYLFENPDQKEEWDRDHKLRDDPRVIGWVGRFLRRTSLDELPQLWNVVRGDMSLVGPRPIVRKEMHRYGDSYALYCQVRPGMTGLWQVSGRNATTYSDRVRFDTYYVMNWSLWLDAYILLRTVRTLVFREGAC